MEIDGAQRSGSGTILRLAVAMASILNEGLHIYNIRKKRGQPGLRPQHLEAVNVAAKLASADVRGAVLGSQELWFRPSGIVGGDFEAEIGTAGSIPMLLLAILPMCAFARKPVRLQVRKGGTDVRSSPTINYMKHVLVPMLSKMGLQVELEVKSYGYYPVGLGEVVMRTSPAPALNGLRLAELGKVEELGGISVCTFLKERRVAERQADAAAALLGREGHEARISVFYDTSNPMQKGSSLALWARTDRGAILGADAIGEVRKTSEAVGREAAQNLMEELRAGATVDVHLADMLIPYAALSRGSSVYYTRSLTEHLSTNIWLAEEFLHAKFATEKEGGLYKVERI